jgi:cobalt-zinc-cadmium efflux system outer membrane protein
VDFLTLMVGVEIPLWSGQSDLPLRREMEAMRFKEEAGARDLLNQTVARVLELRAEAERARELSELYRGSIVPQALASVESALSAYRVGKVDYMTLVESELTLNRYEIQTVSLRAEYYQAVAELTALIGETPGGTP